MRSATVTANDDMDDEIEPSTASSRRDPLTRDRILAAAVAIADAEGVGRLTMRSLARSLGYEVMSLYNHVANKDDVLDGMVERVVGEIDLPPDDVEWQVGARRIAMSAHEAIVRHRWVAGLWTSRWPGPNRWRHMEALLELLGRADFPDDLADLAFHAITLHIQGFTQQQIDFTMTSDDEAEMYARIEREVSPDVYPRMLEHIRYHLENETSHDEFGFVLDLILDGLERKRKGADR